MSPRFIRGIRKASEVLLRPDQRWRRHLLIARTLIDRGKPDLAQRSLDRLVADSRRYPDALLPTVRQLRRVGRRAEGLELAEELWEMRAPQSAPYSLACAKVWYDNSLVWRGDIALAQAKQLAPQWKPIYVEEAMNQRWRGNVAVAVEAAQRVIELATRTDERVAWTLFVGEELFKVERFDEAAERMLEGLPARPDAGLLHRLAWSLERSGRQEEALRIYEREARLRGIDPHVPSSRATLHFLAGYYRAAVEASADSDDLESLLVKTRALLLLGDFDRAVATAAGRSTPEAELRELLALALELRGRAVEALETYEDVLRRDLDPDRRQALLFRASRAAHDAGRPEQALRFGLDALPEIEDLAGLDEEVHPEGDELVDDVRLAITGGGLSAALPSIERLALSASSPQNFRRLRRLYAGALAETGQIERAARQLRAAAPLLQPNAGEHRIDAPQLTRAEAYSEALESLPLEPNVIFYESFHGAKTACNPLALCRRLLAEDPNGEWQHVWAIVDGAAVHPDLLGRPNVHFVRLGSYGYRLHLATAGRLVNNTSFPRWFLRREGQRYLNTWHGVPWKHLGSDVAEDPYSFDNIARNLLHATEIAVPDEHTARVLIETQDLQDMLPRTPLVLGYPRVDATLNLGSDRERQIREQLGIAGGKPILLYAPTWRGVVGSAEASTAPFIAAVDEMARRDVEVVLRVHHFVASDLDDIGLPENVRIAPEDIDTNELLGLIDVLVSDYSSLIFDFAPRNRPILKYVYDLDQYTSERGLYFEVDDVPGRSCLTLDALGAELDHALETPACDWSSSATAHAWAQEDGESSGRVLRHLLAPLPKPDRELPAQALFSMGGLNPNGITRSLRSLMATYPAGRTIPRLFLPRSALQDPTARAVADELHRRARFTLHTGFHTGTRQERLAWRRLSSIDEFMPATLDPQIRSRMQRERRLYFGDIEFSAAVDFDGYGMQQAALFALGFSESTTSMYMLHADFCVEAELKYPRHRRIAALMRNFDVLGSVSAAAFQSNREGLGQRFGVPEHLHRELPNTIDVDGIREQSMEPLDPDLEQWYSKEGPHVVMVGRLSVEKNQAAAIAALGELRGEGHELRLLIVGDGPRRQALIDQAAQAGVDDLVCFAGLRENPYPIIAAADALVLPSLAEGQGLVLLEAMILGVPVAASNVPGPASVLEGGRLGMLVDPDPRGVAEALRAVAAGEIGVADFDAEAYQREASAAFQRVIGG